MTKHKFYFSEGNLSTAQADSLRRDIMIISNLCNAFVIAQGLVILYRILYQIHNSKTNQQKLTNRLNWLSAAIISLIVLIAVVLILVLTIDQGNRWSDFVIDTIITGIIVTWLVHWRESVRVLIKKRFTKAIVNNDKQQMNDLGYRIQTLASKFIFI